MASANYKFHSNLLVPFLVLFFLVIDITPSSGQDTTQQIIEHICRQMEEFGFCRQTFKENLKSPNADIVALTQITIERATDNATKTHDFIRQLLDSATDPAFKNALTACENAYRVIMESFDSAAVSFFQKDYDSVEKSESPTLRAEASCQDSLSTPPHAQNPLTDRNRQMRILIAMALVSVHDLKATGKKN